MLQNLRKAPSRSLMAASGALCSLLLSRPHSFLPPTSNTYRNPNPSFNLPSRTQTLKFYVNSESKDKLNDYPCGEKKSFVVATGELFLGLASRIIKRNNGNGDLVSLPVSTLRETEDLEGESYVRERIASVVKDSVDSDVVWEQSLKDVEAERDLKKITSPGFSFSAAGLLFPYHLGVAQFLIEKGYIKETTPLAGSSAGAIVCAVIASGSSMQEALKATKILAEDCRLRGTAFRLGAVLRNVLQEFLPDDVHSRSNGRVRVAVTQILWRPKGLLVDQFDSKEDLINAVITSSFIPGYLAPRPATIFRNRLCVDGGLTLFMPPTSAAHTVRVCAFPADQLSLKEIGISPHCNPDNRLTIRQLFQWAMEPAEDVVLDRLFELGYLDAAAWAEHNPVKETMEDQSNPNRSQVQDVLNPDDLHEDIHPGPVGL
ncbi:patatin-like phospholipase domain-containing protein 2 [Macadamia integrifolia]|uniref:patatin-like phospholipase domain-containing protein 2 n=1 Tax=Macadamia integrifolia TaxID=60698 RepID=UPI001C4F4E14|nr:patatin-like phospholipase domain-containing protein 2 [Macadamia integrifolia]